MVLSFFEEAYLGIEFEFSTGDLFFEKNDFIDDASFMALQNNDNPPRPRFYDLTRNVKTYKKYLRLELYNTVLANDDAEDPWNNNDVQSLDGNDIVKLNEALLFLTESGQPPPVSIFEKGLRHIEEN
jgi:hypothetical protein